jgi:hypothetical protein
MWFHGSPLKLTVLKRGSTITQHRHLAEVFSHKPAVVSMNDDGTIKHNGKLPGNLYRIAEEMAPGDAYPHPNTTMSPGQEWLTTRDLRLELIGPVKILEKERLSEQEIVALRARQER